MFGIDDAAGAALISGAMSAGSNIFGGLLGSSGQAATNAQQMSMMYEQQNFAANEAWKNREWQEKMSNSAYQRAMGDMKLAGLNPILAGFSGGASTPGGAMASPGSMPNIGNPGAAMGAGVASAGQAAAQAAQVKSVLEVANKDRTQADLNKVTEGATKATEALNKQLEVKAQQDTATSAAQQKVADENAKNIGQDTTNKVIQSGILAHDVTTAQQRARLTTADADQSSKWGPGVWGALGGTTEKLLGRLGQAARDFNQTFATDVVGAESATSRNPPVNRTPGGRRY